MPNTTEQNGSNHARHFSTDPALPKGGLDPMRRPNYEVDEQTFPAEAYTARGYKGVAWRVYGWELEGVFPEYETECSCFGEDVHCRFCDGTGTVWMQDDEPEEVRTGRVVCVMVGDDRRFTF